MGDVLNDECTIPLAWLYLHYIVWPLHWISFQTLTFPWLPRFFHVFHTECVWPTRKKYVHVIHGDPNDSFPHSTAVMSGLPPTSEKNTFAHGNGKSWKSAQLGDGHKPISHIKTTFQNPDLDGKWAPGCGKLPAFTMYLNGNRRRKHDNAWELRSSQIPTLLYDLRHFFLGCTSQHAGS